MKVYVMLFTVLHTQPRAYKNLVFICTEATESAHLTSIGTLDLALAAPLMEYVIGILGQNANEKMPLPKTPIQKMLN